MTDIRDARGVSNVTPSWWARSISITFLVLGLAAGIVPRNLASDGFDVAVVEIAVVAVLSGSARADERIRKEAERRFAEELDKKMAELLEKAKQAKDALSDLDTRALFKAGRCGLLVEWGDPGTLQLDDDAEMVRGKIYAIAAVAGTVIPWVFFGSFLADEGFALVGFVEADDFAAHATAVANL